MPKYRSQYNKGKIIQAKEEFLLQGVLCYKPGDEETRQSYPLPPGSLKQVLYIYNTTAMYKRRLQLSLRHPP